MHNHYRTIWKFPKSEKHIKVALLTSVTHWRRAAPPQDKHNPLEVGTEVFPVLACNAWWTELWNFLQDPVVDSFQRCVAPRSLDIFLFFVLHYVKKKRAAFFLVIFVLPWTECDLVRSRVYWEMGRSKCILHVCGSWTFFSVLWLLDRSIDLAFKQFLLRWYKASFDFCFCLMFFIPGVGDGGGEKAVCFGVFHSMPISV